jgi:hypothetical protein
MGPTAWSPGGVRNRGAMGPEAWRRFRAVEPPRRWAKEGEDWIEGMKAAGVRR